ncbi:MAG: tRNA (adenosine(37)-N6)-threonylcarbamoyltransferase complex dimerization subunit type 1 TsaB [Clostridia bacterium]|nr:tRNA (adenosine(37)-N6)-threonylcarbamoyltransferase complex dimerization subunit type 1 TsaB [Clostridia bacterium]
MKILAIDCTAAPASVAVTEDGKILSSSFTNVGLTHSQTLMPMLDAVLKNAQISRDDIDLFAINAGPGSFTGVRIGVAALKGLTLSDGPKCLPVSTLESMAYNFCGVRDCTVVGVMDARCRQVYTAAFAVLGETVERLSEDSALSFEEFETRLKTYKTPVVLVGDGAALCYNEFQKNHPELELAPEHLRYQNAVGTAACAARHLAAGETPVSGSDILPVYLRAPQAERELKKKQEAQKA